MKNLNPSWPVSPERMARGLYWHEAWKLVEGCTHVSAGCDRCWSAKETHARAAHPNVKISVPKQGLVEGGHFNGKIRLRKDNLDKPLRRRKPTVYAIWNDLFHEDVPKSFIVATFSAAINSNIHKYLFLTKRPERLNEVIAIAGECGALPIPLPLHLWLGVSVEDQKTADERIPLLLQTPAAKRFVSYEPALGLVDFSAYLPQTVLPDQDDGTGYMTTGLNWIIMGGENGKGARPMNPDWARKTRDDCKAAGVPFFFKNGVLDGVEHKEVLR